MHSLAAHSPPRPLRGFTLLELVLVMLLLSVMLAIAMPSMRGFAAGTRSRDGVTQFVAVAQWAKARAAADARVVRLNVGNGTYWLTAQRGTEFVPVETDFGQTFELPRGMRVQVTPAGTEMERFDASGVGFYPDGRTDPAVFRFVAGDGRVTLIGCPSPAESFRVMSAEEVGQP